MEWSPALNLSETPVSVPLMIPHHQKKSKIFFVSKLIADMVVQVCLLLTVFQQVSWITYGRPGVH